MSAPFIVQRPQARPSRSVLGIALVLTASLCFALSGFIASRVVGVEVRGVTIAFLEAAFGFAFVFGLRLGTHWRLPRGRAFTKTPVSAYVWLVLAAVATALGFGGFYSALNYEDLSVISPITGSVPLVSYAFILVLLRGEERLTPRAVLSAVLVVTGVVLIGITNP